jgi:hypothetical protein
MRNSYPPDFTREFKGNISPQVPITFHMISKSGSVAGNYEYDKYRKKIAIRGIINEDSIFFDGIYKGVPIDNFRGGYNPTSISGFWKGYEQNKTAMFYVKTEIPIKQNSITKISLYAWLIIGGLGLCVFFVFRLFRSDSDQQSPDKLIVLPESPKTLSKIDPIIIGKEFEEYVVEQFNKKYYQLIEWRSDKYLNGKYPISNKNPDLVFERLNTQHKNSKFAIECKYRSIMLNGIFEFDKVQLNNYIKYGNESSMPVFLALGIGGKPSCPEILFIIPVTETTTSRIDMSKLNYYKRTGKNLFYDPEKGSL